MFNYICSRRVTILIFKFLDICNIIQVLWFICQIIRRSTMVIALTWDAAENIENVLVYSKCEKRKLCFFSSHALAFCILNSLFLYCLHFPLRNWFSLYKDKTFKGSAWFSHNCAILCERKQCVSTRITQTQV